jgi:hypothetical protein
MAGLLANRTVQGNERETAKGNEVRPRQLFNVFRFSKFMHEKAHQCGHCRVKMSERKESLCRWCPAHHPQRRKPPASGRRESARRTHPQLSPSPGENVFKPRAPP